MEYSTTLHYKACLTLGTLKDQTLTTLFQSIQKELYTSLKRTINLDMQYQHFMTSGFHRAQDIRNMKTETLTLPSPADDSQLSLWAVKIRLQDKDNRRRIWSIHIGLVPDEEANVVRLYYAETYSDHNAGAYSTFPQPENGTPQLILDIMNNEHFGCIIGDYVLPPAPLKLTKSNSDMFIDLVYDRRRAVPVLVVSCPELVNVEMLSTLLAGNGIVFHISSAASIASINKLLPDDMRIPKNAVKIYRDAKEDDTVYHLTHTADELAARGIPVFARALRRAYCERMRPDEKHGFVSLDEVQHMLQERVHTEKDAALERVQASLEAYRKKCIALQDELDDCTAYMNRDLQADMLEHEKLSAACMEETDALKKQVMKITKELFDGSSATALLNETPSCAAIAHLLEAVSYRISSIWYARHQKKG